MPTGGGEPIAAGGAVKGEHADGSIRIDLDRSGVGGRAKVRRLSRQIRKSLGENAMKQRPAPTTRLSFR
jgi:hypothetical protein